MRIVSFSGVSWDWVVVCVFVGVLVVVGVGMEVGVTGAVGVGVGVGSAWRPTGRRSLWGSERTGRLGGCLRGS